MNEAHASYMACRSLSLLLGDARGGVPIGDAIDFAPEQARSSDSAPAPYVRCLVLLLNTWAACKALTENILPRVSEVVEWTTAEEVTATPKGRIDWTRTLERRLAGEDGYVVKSLQRTVSRDGMRHVALALEEARSHCEAGLAFIESLRRERPRILDELGRQLEHFERTLAEALGSRLGASLAGETAACSRFREAIRQELELNDGACLEAYGQAVSLAPPRGASDTLFVKDIARWRQQYLRCSIWLSERTGFQFQAKGAEAHLYELWCFAEFIRAAESAGLGETVQRTFLSRERTTPEFRVGAGHYVYYDLRESGFRNARSDAVFGGTEPIVRALPRTHVEWFIRDPEHLTSSTVIDTKYRGWDSEQVLKVLGYLLSFGVRKGAVIFRDDIDGQVEGAAEREEGIARFDCPPDGAHRLWVMTLTPEPDLESRNQAVLRRFVTEALASIPS